MPQLFRRQSLVSWIVIFLLMLVGVFAASVVDVSAQTATDTLGLNAFDETTVLSGGDIRVTIARIINVFLSVLGVIAVVIVVYGGFVYMTAGGNEERVAQARKILINGGIGLILIFSSWAIARFVLIRLQEQTGLGDNAEVTDSTTTRITQQFNCSLNPTWCCARDTFIVQSITPRTDAAQLNNAIIRAVFSRGVSTPDDQVMQIFRGTVRVDNEFAFAFTDATRRVVEATYTASSTCATPGCMPQGEYQVRIQDVRDNNNGQLETAPACGGSFPRDARFTVTANGVVDTVAPPSFALLFNGIQQQDQPLPIGQTIQTSISAIDNTGIGYVRFAVGPENRAPDVVVYDGPTVQRGSDAPAANPYVFSYPLTLATNIQRLQRYEVTATVYDLDNNPTTVTSSFVTVGNHCFNNVQDGDETGIDVGGSCLGVDSCTADWQCASGQCTEGQCVSTPMITRVDPWDGASGNWVTVFGRFFGEDAGQVSFGYDQNSDGTVAQSEWIPAQLAQCGGGLDVWHDEWVVVAIPGDAQLPQGSTGSIRLIRSDDPVNVDTTNNTRGPIGGPNNDGLFTKNERNRPGICRVEAVDTSATAANPRAPVRVIGQGFGSSGVLSFGGLTIPSGSWSASLITATVPESLQPGLVGVNVRAEDEVSNGFPFTILAPDENLIPIISTISPATTTNDSLITLQGQGFGHRVGQVFFTTDPAAACTPQDLSNDVCIPARTTLDAACGDTWSTQQVVVQIAGIDTSAQYIVRLRNAAGFQTTDNDDLVAIDISRDPTPGICRVTPNQGPAPRSAVQITGLNFATPLSAHFWSVTAAQNATNIGNWPVFTTGGQITVDSARSLRTPIPITAAGETMRTGPIYIQTQGGLSNAVNYEVLDCRAVPDTQHPEGYHCCEDGSYRTNDTACPGETRDAGYVWRFTTGKTPSFPYVIEQCQEGLAPSPSPWRQWDSGRPACINAELRVRFNLDMDPASLENGIQIFTCGTRRRPDCDNRQLVTDQFTILPLTRGAQITPNSSVLEANTWYHVELLNSVQSQHNEVVLAQNTTVNEALRRTRPCSDDTAYCFDFQTDDQRCELANAFIDPPTALTKHLGMIQDRRYPFSFADPLQVPYPFYFHLWGQADRACIVLPVDGLGWQWDTDDATAATAAAAPSVGSRQFYTDSRATAIALRNTVPDTVDIRAVTSTITATSTLTVNLADPTVIDYWPNCTESCTNANIGVQFSTYMLSDTYANAFAIQECTDALCTGTTGINIPYDVITADPTIFRVTPQQPLEENRWYRVSVSDDARAATALGSTVPGNPLEPFSWRFRTKAQDGFCIAGQIIVEPHPFIARRIGQKTRYQAIPYSSPNQCNTRGQGLNPWAYGWEWQTTDRNSTINNDVAVVTTFESIAAPKPYCTQGCLPSGSDVRADQTAPPLCGDGTVDRGEDCDIGGTFIDSSNATANEVAGVSCTLRCQRPGSSAATCGDGTVQPEFGEACDPGDNPTGCSETCQFTGSTNDAAAVLATSLSYCGDGAVDAASGEQCDVDADTDNDGVLDEIPDVTCSSQNCLRLGNRFAEQDWCTQNAAVIIDGNNTQARQTRACLRAISVCGNGIVEDGEQCEVVTRNATTGEGTIRLAGQTGTFPVTDTTVCSDSCLLQTICTQNGLPTQFVCTAQEGCRPDGCTYAGSSLFYSEPSLCGDGVVGIGEIAMCEYDAADVTAANVIGQDPVQLVTARGRGQVNPATDLQEALVQARATQVQRTTSQRESIDVVGRGEYSLQCGYTEYPTVRTVNGTDQLNDCPGNANNTSGVGYNSCCYSRPSRTREYPADGTGLVGSGTLPVCINTYIDVEFDGHIDEETLRNNVLLAQGFTTQTDCTTVGQRDVTAMVTGTIAFQDSSLDHGGFFQRLWRGIRSFFHGFFGGGAFATTQQPQIVSWCSGAIRLTPYTRYGTATGQVVSTTIRLSIDKALTENTTYAVVMRGGLQGIRDVRGVGIQPERITGTDDSWIFQTDPTGRICEIDTVTVAPDPYVFTRPNSSTLFTTDVFDDTGARLQAVPGVYNWETAWGPNNHPAFAIPASGPSSTENIQIGSRTVEGRVAAFTNLTITENAQSGAIGRVHPGTTELRALFCENLWPPRQYYPYEDGFPRNSGPNDDGFSSSTGMFDGSAIPAAVISGQQTYFNFSTGYCADAGNAATTTDDLPYLRPLVFVEDAGNGGGGQTQGLEPIGSMRDDVGGIGRILNSPRGIVVRGDRAYVVSSRNHSLEIISVSNPANPQPLSRLVYDGSSGQVMKEPTALAIAGNTAYVLAGGRGNGGFQVIDISNETQPQFRGSLLHSATAQPRLYGAKDIVVVGNYAYVTVSGFETRSNGLQVIDVSNPTNPVPVGFINHGQFGARLFGAKGLFVRGDYAYVTVTGFGIEGLQIIDIRNPAALRPAGFVQHSARAPLIGAEDVFVDGDYAYVTISGLLRGRSIADPALSVISIADPNSPQWVAALAHNAPALLDGANTVVVSNNIAYVTAQRSRAVTAISVADPTNPVHIDSLESTTVPPQMYFNQLVGMWVSNGFVYTISEGSNSLEIIDARSIGVTIPARAGGSTQLPNEVLKRYLFTNTKNNDAIGFQIFENAGSTPVRQWFEDRHGDAAQFQDVIVGGFTAISDGNNTYVSFLNQGVVPNDVDHYILLLSINRDAQDATRQVYAQFIDNLEFLINVSDIGYCSVGDNSNPQNIFTPDAAASVQCRTDFDCLDIDGRDRVCANAKTKLLRDWQRVVDVKRIQNELRRAGATARFPNLQAGTYYQQYTNSRWPSWNQTLAASLRAAQLPQDPINDWSACSGRDPQTCWDTDTATFFCPAVTSIYEYVAAPDGSAYTLHVPFEYFTPTGGIIEELDASTLSFDRWCTASTTYSPFARRCGDGIVNTTVGTSGEPAEECDPAGETRVRAARPADSCAPGEQVQETCSTTCTYTQSQCIPQFTCGNGIVEVGEQCDDGAALNGRYGQCAGPNSGTVDACQGLHPAYCGNSANDFTDTNSDGFRDTGEIAEEYCEINAGQFANQGFCQKRSCLNLSLSARGEDIPGSRFDAHGVHVLRPDAVWTVGNGAPGGGVVRGEIHFYNGSSWVQQYSGPNNSWYSDVVFIDERNGWVVGDHNGNGVVLRTGDGGQTWSATSVPGVTGQRFLSVDFVNTQVGAAITQNTLATTRDGGQTWTSTAISSAGLRDIDLVTEQRGWIVGQSATLLFTDDGGQTWTPRLQTVTMRQMNEVEFVNQSVGYIAASDEILKTVDGGSSWQSASPPSFLQQIAGGSVSFQSISFSDPYTGIVHAGLSRVFVTNDGGFIWQQQEDIAITNNTFVNRVSLYSDQFGMTAGNGNSVQVLTADPYCVGVTTCPVNACQNGDPCLGAGDPGYHAAQGQACSLTCKAPGGYCGDGVVNTQYEECEPGDADCTPYCLRRTRPQQSSPGITQGCGNGIIDAGEQCDNAGQNGQECEAGYGQTCTYCSTQCRTLTRDATAFCGDGVLQRDQGEVCDIGPTSDSALVWNGSQAVVSACTAGQDPEDNRGSVVCVDNCRRIESTCTVCGYVEQCSCASGVDTGGRDICSDGEDNDGDGAVDCSDTTGGGALPQIAILNPTIGAAEAAAYVPTSWGASNAYNFIRPRLSNLPVYDLTTRGKLGHRGMGGVAHPDYRQTLSIFEQDLWSGPLINNVFINTDVMCRDAYYLDVDGRFIPEGVAGIADPSDLIPYPVSGEPGTVRNEVVISPPVPENVFRVVVRWGADELEAGAQFIGRAYNDSFGTQNARIADLTAAIASNNLCTNITRQQQVSTRQGVPAEYWWPATGNCTPFDDVVYVHPRLASSTLFTNTFIQGMTIDVRNATSLSGPISFFVDEISGPIRPYERSRSLFVDVYTYHRGQHTLQGNYLPQTFPITEAAGTSTNPNDEYWHVFNLVRNQTTGEWRVVPVQSIERDVQEVLRNR